MERNILLVFFFFLAIPLVAQERHGPYKIHKFVDGDTFWVKISPGNPEKNHLLRLDLLKSVRFVNIFLNL